jgi:hypothetical protein
MTLSSKPRFSGSCGRAKAGESLADSTVLFGCHYEIIKVSSAQLANTAPAPRQSRRGLTDRGGERLEESESASGRAMPRRCLLISTNHPLMMFNDDHQASCKSQVLLH